MGKQIRDIVHNFTNAKLAHEQRTWHEKCSKRSKNFHHATVVLMYEYE